jgi:hypothetical protein
LLRAISLSVLHAAHSDRCVRRDEACKASRRAWLAAGSGVARLRLTAPSTARGSSGSDACTVSPRQLEGTSFGQHRPGDAGKLVGERDRQHVVVQPPLGCFDPGFEPATFPVLYPDQHNPCRLHEQNAQVAIAVPRYFAEDRAVSRRDLLEPGAEVAAFGEYVSSGALVRVFCREGMEAPGYGGAGLNSPTPDAHRRGFWAFQESATFRRALDLPVEPALPPGPRAQAPALVRSELPSRRRPALHLRSLYGRPLDFELAAFSTVRDLRSLAKVSRRRQPPLRRKWVRVIACVHSVYSWNFIYPPCEPCRPCGLFRDFCRVQLNSPAARFPGRARRACAFGC